MTVSKTRDKVRDFVRSKDYSVSVKEYAEFADSLTAELQKENAQLREALIMFRDLFPENHTGDYLISRAECVITQLGAALSKEKAK